MQSEKERRVPFALVVEGHGEYYHLPQMIPLAMDNDWLDIPRPIRAKGWRDVVNRLEEHLTDVVKLHHPYTVAIVLDVADILHPKDGIGDCRTAIHAIRSAIARWYKAAEFSGKLHPLPDRVVLTPACQTFETWIMADCSGLAACSFIDGAVCFHDCENVDAEVVHPAEWITERCSVRVDIKGRDYVAKMVGCIDMKAVRRRSRSFARLCGYAEAAKKRWSEAEAG